MKYFFKSCPAFYRKIKGKEIALFLDFDGTLSELARTPQLARIIPQARKILKKIAANTFIHIAVISGRQLNDLKKKVGVANIVYAGNHGLHIEGPRFSYRPIPTKLSQKTLAVIYRKLRAETRAIDGVLIEDKKFSLAVHFRMVADKELVLVKRIVYNIIKPYLDNKKIRIGKGKKVIEIVLPYNWNKGRAVLWLLRQPQFVSHKNQVVPIYIGDDATDEDAFTALRTKGITVVVGKKSGSRAEYYVENCSDVIRLLTRLYDEVLNNS